MGLRVTTILLTPTEWCTFDHEICFVNTDHVFLERVVFEEDVPSATIEFGPPKPWSLGSGPCIVGKNQNFGPTENL